jgi:hypothetical protein
VVLEVGRRLLANLRTHAGPRPELAAVILDFNGTTLWQGDGSG